ncbi:MAG TPA: hypothetical protein VKU01_16750 [Bryobacteraceae bacterium]|nr:hypothetical protein [Bryobacteraceae bacterium]
MKKFSFGALILGTVMALAAPVSGLAAERDNVREHTVVQRVDRDRVKDNRTEFRDRDGDRYREVRNRDSRNGYYDQYGNWCQR